jgi:hypothetical protein
VADDGGAWRAFEQVLATARSELLAAAPDAATAVEAENYLLRVMTASLNDAFLQHLLTDQGLTRALPTKGGPNPDYLMCHAGVDSTRRYRLDGRLNDSERVGVGLYSITASGATVLEGYARFDASTVDADGRFSLDLALDAAGPGTLKLTTASRVLLVRTLHRAAYGLPCSLSLSGGAPGRGLAPAMGSHDAALNMAANATLRGVRQFLEWTRQTSAHPNRMTAPPASLADEVQGDPDTHYSLGNYELREGEWLEVTIPQALNGYWSLHAYNHWCEYLPNASVHDLKALPDPDGRIRVRIGPTVPNGALNLIDTLGRQRGVLIFRTFSGSNPDIPEAQLQRS